MKFCRAERIVLGICFALVAVNTYLIWLKDITVTFRYVASPLAFAGGVLLLGQVLRRYWPNGRVELIANAVGLSALFSGPCSLLNMLLLPLGNDPVDAQLVVFDSYFGYSWQAACAWVASVPLLSDILWQTYKLTFPLLMISIVFLALTTDRKRLYTVILGTTYASLGTLFIWALFPTAGPSALQFLSPEVERIVHPSNGSEHALELYRIFRNGVTDLTGPDFSGLVGFPSFHTIMLLFGMAAVWPYRPVNYVFAAMQAITLPSILVIGGHHLADVFGGAALTLVCWWAASRTCGAESAPSMAITAALTGSELAKGSQRG
ncbi:MAG: phosphatase PAP2 family protein [Mesorhizobium sp.]|nr:phosphatase PAP2 family protein [Mesorhizobium sp.]MBN9243349.1 phosphatase PAP2 family protein [Mesorhizobium sp.]MBN9273296.1 phosphatase PAP2 family protein [Mesorhizobium sp.]